MCCLQERDKMEVFETMAVKIKPYLDNPGQIPRYFDKLVFRFLQRSISLS